MRKRVASVAVLAASALIAITGCSQTGSAEPGSAPSELVFSGWGGIVDEAMYEAAFDPYTEETGITVVNDSPLSAVKLKSMVEADNVTWDLTMASAVESVRYCGDLYEQVDMSRFDIDDFVPGTVAGCAIPHNYFSTAMVYDTKEFGDNPPTTLADFFDLDKYPGKRLFPEDGAEYGLEFALLADGVAPEDLYPLDVERALAKLDTIKSEIVFWKLGDEQVQAMEAGAVSMGIVWTGRGLQVAQNGGSFDVVWGTHVIGVTNLAIPKGTKNFDAVMDLLEYTLQPERQAKMNELVGYSAANLRAEPNLTEVQQHWDPLFGGKSVDVAFTPDYEFWAENLEGVQTAVSNWAIG